MSDRPSFFLVGDFNGWQLCQVEYRFEEVTSPYGLPDRSDLVLALGSYYLETKFPKGLIRFKIVAEGSWDHQWSVWNSYKDVPYEVSRYHFIARHGLQPNHIVYRGGGTPPHSEFESSGEPLRWDFHPDSQTLTIHSQLRRNPGMIVAPWRTFACGREAEFDTWYCLPYGYDPDDAYKYPVCFMFDGRGLLYGEEDSPWHRTWNNHDRQWPRVLDILARHGVIAPTVVIAIGVPRYTVPKTKEEIEDVRPVAYLEHESSLHKDFAAAICRVVIQEVERHFNVSANANDRSLLGHSEGGDLALNLLAYSPDRFRGAVAISPAAPSRASALAALPIQTKERLRLALAYGSSEPTPQYLTSVARMRKKLLESGISHLVQYFPDATHDPASVLKYLPGCIGFVMP